MDSWYVPQKTQFTRFQSIYACLSVYRHNVRTHYILSKSCVPRPRCFSFHNSGTKQPITSIFFTTTQLNIDIPMSGLISIFIKCGMCRVFIQQVTYTVGRTMCTHYAISTENFTGCIQNTHTSRACSIVS